MSTNDTFLAVFLGSKNSAKWAAWNALSETERKAREMRGISAWKGWIEKHKGAIVEIGGPLGKTKKVDGQGIADITNPIGAFTVAQLNAFCAWASDARLMAARFSSAVVRIKVTLGLWTTNLRLWQRAGTVSRGPKLTISSAPATCWRIARMGRSKPAMSTSVSTRDKASRGEFA